MMLKKKSFYCFSVVEQPFGNETYFANFEDVFDNSSPPLGTNTFIPENE